MVDISKKTLFVFDFDHTIVDGNSDTFIYNVLPEKDLPNSLHQSYREGFWTEFMQKVFIFLKNQGKSPEDIKKCLENIPLTVGLVELISWIRKSQNDCIVISDSNTLFIDWILEKNNLRNDFSFVFTNPAKINENLIEIQTCHSHKCKVCPINMCKKEILEEFIKEKSFEKIVYVGDGGNDYCPVTILSENDWVFARKGYSLEKKIAKNKQEGIFPKIGIWENGFDIINKLEGK